MKRFALSAALTVLPALAASAQDPGDPIRPLTLLAQPEAAAPQEYQAAQIIADAWRKLGVTVTVRPLPGQEFNRVIWYERQRWDFTTWQMVGRPKRSDPDELTYNLFVSANADNGYDFVAYGNPEYDKLAQQQREELDLDKRRAFIMQAQELSNHDQPYGFEVHPKNVVAYTAFLPFSISIAGTEFPRQAATISGALIAFHQVGYGIAAFGVGPLRQLAGREFSALFSACSLVALALAIVALMVIRHPAHAAG